MDKRDIKDFTIDELKKELAGRSVAAYRAEQIFRWIYKMGVRDLDDMDNIPKAVREALKQEYRIGDILLKDRIRSSDGTEKFLFELCDGNFVESVIIRGGRRKTLCLSTQVGCRFACSFCASGLKGFRRNLSASEIISQILFLEHTLGHKITNFVFMGMGEPLDNFENLVRAVKIMNCPQGLAIGARRITISTCGIIPGIEQLGRLGLQVNLSISLHAAADALRNSLLPVNRRYPLRGLIAACEDFIKRTGRRITLEYVLINGKNGSIKDAEGLSSIARRLKAKVNLIPYSPVCGKDFESPSSKDINAFQRALIKKGVNATLRESKGRDIHAACGQLGLHTTLHSVHTSV